MDPALGLGHVPRSRGIFVGTVGPPFPVGLKKRRDAADNGRPTWNGPSRAASHDVLADLAQGGRRSPAGAAIPIRRLPGGTVAGAPANQGATPTLRVAPRAARPHVSGYSPSSQTRSSVHGSVYGTPVSFVVRASGFRPSLARRANGGADPGRRRVRAHWSVPEKGPTSGTSARLRGIRREPLPVAAAP